MAEVKPIDPTSASAWLQRRESRFVGLGRSHLFTFIEAALDPLVSVFSLWALAFYVEGFIAPAYLILSIIVFSLTFPGISQFRLPTWKMAFNIVCSWLWISALLLLTGFVTGYFYRFSMAVVINWLWLVPVSQVSAHIVLRAMAPQLLKLQGAASGAIIVGMNNQGISLAKHIVDSTYSGIELRGFFDDRGEERRGKPDVYRLLGNIQDLPAYVKQHRVQFIYLSLPMTARPRILQVLDGLKDTTASIYFVPDMFITELIQGRSDSVCGVTVISVCDTPFRGFNGVLKRASDIVFSLLILLMIFPIMLLIGLAVKLGSPGPIIFKQRRYGLDGEQIVVYKFRSMAVTEDGNQIEQAKKNDLRITKLGAFLRKTSLDELPQFINVLQGRMSVVGPRPHAIAHNEMYRTLIKGYMVRHKVRPGITGWAQVNGLRGETDTLKKMQSRIDCDLDYLRNWSLQLDLFIIFKTIRLIFKDSTAY